MTAGERNAILALLNSVHVTGPTRRALLERLDARYGRQFFTEAEFALLRAVAVRLVPHDPAEMDLTGTVDHRLHSGAGDGWRYDAAPPDGVAYRALLTALPAGFETLDGEAQDAALHAVRLSHPHAFEDLLTELTEVFMAHPLTQYRIGYAGFADAPGWPQVGPNELEPREELYGPR
jgi:gluconate 2-dehydrogenase gamma chain